MLTHSVCSSSCSQGLTLDASGQTTNLQMMVKALGIPDAPVIKPLSERFTLVSLQSALSGVIWGGRGPVPEEVLGVTGEFIWEL